MKKFPVIRKVLVAVAIVLPFVACNVEDAADVNQDKIYTDYELFYDANTDKSTAVARFRFGDAIGTILQLMDTTSAYVTFNGDTLTYNWVWSAHTKEYAGLVSSGTFVYENLNGDVFTNTLPAFDTIAFAPDLDTIVRSQANTITWVGSPLAADQTVGIFVGSWTWGQDAAALQTNLGATNLILGLNDVSNLPVGPSTLYMDRATEREVAQGTEKGGRIRGKYRAPVRVVQVVD